MVPNPPPSLAAARAPSRQARRLFGPQGLFASGPDTAAQPVPEMLRHALHVLRAHLGMEAAFISEFRDGRCILRFIDADPCAGDIAEGDSHPLAHTYCARMVDGRLPPAVRDVCALPEARALAASAPVPVGSCLGVPIRLDDGALYGAFCCFSRRADPTLNDRDVETMRLFAEFAAGVLQQHSAACVGLQEVRERIARVLRDRDFTIVYQPIFSVARGRLVGYEALTRFGGEPARSPEAWFAEAAAAGLLEELELAVLREALAGFGGIPRHVYLSVNVSPATILHGDLATELPRALLGRLVLEVTEHASIDDYAALAARLEPLRRLGVRLAVDDAGAGFASFRHILKIRPDDIKLDISLIRKIDSDQGARALAAALIRFARETGSKIVAEGVETESVMQVLRQLRVDKAQGYLTGRPGPLPRAMDERSKDHA